jgi:hypothetical protein
MIRTRLILAAAVIGAAGLWHSSWGQAPVPVAGGPPGSANNFFTGRVHAQPGGPGFNFFYAQSDDHQLNHEIHENLGKLTAETDAAKKADLEKEIKASLAKQFDARQEAREQELKNLEERVKQLRDLFDKRQKAKDEIVDTRFQELVRASSGLGWGDDAGGGPYGLNVLAAPVPVGLPYGPAGDFPNPPTAPARR